MSTLSTCFAQNTQSCRTIPSYLSCCEVQALLQLDSIFRGLIPDLVRVLHFCHWVDDNTVTIVSDRFRRSTIIHLQGCLHVTNGIVAVLNRLEFLHTLNLSGTQVTDLSAFASSGSLQNLKKLIMSGCTQLRGTGTGLSFDVFRDVSCICQMFSLMLVCSRLK